MIARMLAFALALTFGIGPLAAEETIVNTPPIRVVITPQKPKPPSNMTLVGVCPSDKPICCDRDIQSNPRYRCDTSQHCTSNSGTVMSDTSNCP
jgi:hypothetical protein